jgi:hypothetical protein
MVIRNFLKSALASASHRCLNVLVVLDMDTNLEMQLKDLDMMTITTVTKTIRQQSSSALAKVASAFTQHASSRCPKMNAARAVEMAGQETIFAMPHASMKRVALIWVTAADTVLGLVALLKAGLFLLPGLVADTVLGLLKNVSASASRR